MLPRFCGTPSALRYFFSRDGYVFAIRAPVLADGTKQAIYEVKSVAKVSEQSTELIEREILDIMVKPASEYTPLEWQHSLETQLVPYLDGMTSNPNDVRYAAIAIGSKIRFWLWMG